MNEQQFFKIGDDYHNLAFVKKAQFNQYGDCRVTIRNTETGLACVDEVERPAKTECETLRKLLEKK